MISELQRRNDKAHIGIIHYTLPPVIAGVEMVIRDHARLLENLGYKVHLLGAVGKKFRSEIPVQLARSFHPRNQQVQEIQNALLLHSVPSTFDILKNKYKKIIIHWIQKNKIQSVIVHNVLSRHYNLALTAALVEVAKELKSVHFICWVHDASFLDTSYTNLDPQLKSEYPWNLIAQVQPHFTYVTVSKARREELYSLYGKKHKIHIVYNGLDINKMLPLTKQIRLLFKEINSQSPDYIGVIPVRIAQRKNIEYAISFAQVARDVYGKKLFFIITGPRHEQKSGTDSYFIRLKNLITTYNLEKHFIFLAQHRLPDKELFDIEKLHMRDLYLITDFLFLPSKGEGFGLPLIEAGFMRIPIFASQLKVFNEVGNGYIQFLNKEDSIDINVNKLLHYLSHNKSTVYHKLILQKFDLEKIVKQELVPLL